MSTVPLASDAEVLCDRLREALERDRLQLPVLPEIAVRVRAAVNDPFSDAIGLAQIVGVDAALAARVVRLANSASFAGLVEIRDLPRAIARLGPTMIVALAMGAAGKDVFRSQDPVFHERLGIAWGRSLLAGCLARRLAPETGMDRDLGFLAALLHDVGEPVLLDLLLPYVRSAKWPRPSGAVLGAALATLRADAGARLLTHWKIPAVLVDAVAAQDRVAPDAPEPSLPCLLHLVGRIAADHVPGPVPTGPPWTLPPWLGIDALTFDERVVTAFEAYEELRQVL